VNIHLAPRGSLREVTAMSGDGLGLLPGHLSREAQEALLADVMARVATAPFVTPRLPRTGAAMSVVQTNFGALGWVTDQAKGYRYESVHPETREPWPAIPEGLLALWDKLAGYPAPPEACLVNWYREGARMGLHVDADEAAKDAPVLSVSLGDTALFRVGGASRRDPTRSFRLQSGDVVVLAGAARHFYHGVDRVMAGTSRLVPGGGRINLTLRRVTALA
jgi:DNA oxidative demethylase